MQGECCCLAWFSSHKDFFRCRIAELTALASLFGVSSAELWTTAETRATRGFPVTSGSASCAEIVDFADHGSAREITLGCDDFVFVFCQLRLSVAAEILERSVLLRGFAKIWAHGASYEEVIRQLQDHPEPRKHIRPGLTFSFLVKSFGNRLSFEEQIERMSRFAFLFTGEEAANLQTPDVQLVIFEQWNRSRTENSAPSLQHVYFGHATVMKSKKELPWWFKYRLSVRPVLGPTTMDAELSFIMANQAQIKRGMVVLDPLMGSGGLLIAASHFGAFCIGGDIDARVLNGWGISQLNKNISHAERAVSDVFYNFSFYGLPRPDIVRSDIATLAGFDRRHRPFADAILADVPYGVRATVREASASRPNDTETTIANSRAHTSVSTVGAVVLDLLRLAASFLVDGGRLVFLLPVELNRIKMRDAINGVLHKDFVLEAASLQDLTSGAGRVLLTMRRTPRDVIATDIC